jgi:WD40 repeat protein
VRALAVSTTALSTAVLAIGGDDGTITIVMGTTWENKRTLTGHGSGVSALVSMMQQPKLGELALEHNILFSSGSEDGTIKAWVADDDGTYTMQQTLTGHCNGASALKLKQCAVQALALTMDEAGDATLFSGSDDGTVKLWIV